MNIYCLVCILFVVGVANILVEEGGIEDLAVIQAALLHDTVEDTDTTLAELEQHFGSKVRQALVLCIFK